MIFLSVFVLNLAFVCCVDLTESTLCTAEFCEEERENRGCVDNVPQGCADNGLMAKSPTSCNCCQYCIAYLEENADCDTGSPTAPTVQNICGPGLTCDSKVCTKMTEPECTKRQHKYDVNGNFGDFSWRPLCDNEGNFGPIHCIPSSVCFCIEPDKGERIFGEALYTQETAQSMSCSCSLASWKAANLQGKKNFFRCSPDGQYDELQCIDGECFCVNQITGTPIGTTRVHVTNLKEGALPCFDKEVHSVGRFEKFCELEYKTKIDEMKLWEIEGIQVLYVQLPNCTEDGHYYRVQLEPNGAGFKCVDPEGNLIGTFKSDYGISDCNCAYTRWLMSKTGLQELPSCNKDGSFRIWQCLRDKCYCVDTYGNQISEHALIFPNPKEAKRNQHRSITPGERTISNVSKRAQERESYNLTT